MIVHAEAKVCCLTIGDDTNNNVGFRFRTIEVQEIRDALAKAKT